MGAIPGSKSSAGEGIGYSLLYSWASLVAQLVKNPPAIRRPWFHSRVRKIHWRRDRLPTPPFLGFPCGSTGKESACNAGDLGLIPGLENPHGRRSSRKPLRRPRPRELIKSGPGNRGRSQCGPTHVARLEFPRETGLILRCAWKARNPFQTTQGNRLSCRDQEGRDGKVGNPFQA